MRSPRHCRAVQKLGEWVQAVPDPKTKVPHVTAHSFGNRIHNFFELVDEDLPEEAPDIIAECALSEYGVDPESTLPLEFQSFFDRCCRDLEQIQSGKCDRIPIIDLGILESIGNARLTLRNIPHESIRSIEWSPKLVEFFRRCGLIQREPDVFRFGTVSINPKSPASTLFEGLHNLPRGILLPPPHRNNFGNSNEPIANQTPTDDIDLTQYHEFLRQYMRDVLRSAESITKSWFVNLPEAEKFYLHIQTLYGPDGNGFLPEVFVFSTTSGLVVKEQYHGSNIMQTSRWRRDYFEFLRTSGCKIYYQLDPKSTWKSPKGLNSSQLPMEAHQRHFASFLQIANLELTETSFELPENAWRREYTIVSSRGEVAFSNRSMAAKEISEGLIATKRFYDQTLKDPFPIIRTLYDHQLRPSQIIKKLGESLTESEANERASETFQRWRLEFGN